MKKIKQILGVVAVFLLVVGCYSQTLQAKELTNSEMIEDSNMELYGQAKFLDDDSIQLTPLETNSSGCVWYPHSVDTTQDFSITVSYWIGGGRELPYEGADGMILGFTEKKGIGSNGEYQGFVSGEKSYGVELDSYPYNRGDPDGKHIAIIKNNVRNHLKYVLDDRVDDSAWHKLSVSYKAKEKTLTVYLDEKEVLASDGIELSQKCYLGISAATASGCNQHLIKNISIDGKIGQGRKIKYSIKDTYSFVNLTDKIPEKIYTKKFGQLLGRALRTIHDGTAGQCYGMAATVAASAEYNSPAASSYVDESNIKVIANENGIAAARPLWLPALSKEIDIHDINVENIMFAGSIKAVVGMIDNPESQSQYPYYIDFSEFSNLMIVGNQGCGKSTFIQTILYSMAMNYHSDDVNFYILDFSSGLLHNFMKLPHCGNVAQVDEEDSVNRTIRYLISVIEERNQIFKKAGVGGFWEFKKISKEPMPLLLLVIDNYFAFGENYESLEGDITTLLRSGFRCGIQVIVSANRMNDMKFRLRQNITRVVPLQLNERMDYMEALGSYLAGFTATVRGRGLCKEEEILEFQTALVSSEKTEYERIRKVSAEFEAMAKTEKYHARSILVLPENETYGEFLEKMPEEMLEDYIPIGYEQKEIQPYTVSLKESFCYLISGIGRKGVDNLLENTTEYLAATENLPTKKELYLVHLNKNCAIEEERAEAVYKNDEDIFSMLLFLKEEFTKRNKWRKEYLAEGKEERLYSILKKEFAQLFFIIDDFTAFLELVYKSHGTESYFPITELFFKEGKGLGIYFIAGIDTGNSASAVYTQAYKNFTNEKKGIHLGGQLNQQNLFQFQIPITKQLTRLDDNIGCFVEKETPYSVFIPWNQSQ